MLRTDAQVLLSQLVTIDVDFLFFHLSTCFGPTIIFPLPPTEDDDHADIYVLPDCILFYFPPLFRTFYPFLLHYSLLALSFPGPCFFYSYLNLLFFCISPTSSEDISDMSLFRWRGGGHIFSPSQLHTGVYPLYSLFYS